jgi:hypothetical protein
MTIFAGSGDRLDARLFLRGRGEVNAGGPKGAACMGRLRRRFRRRGGLMRIDRRHFETLFDAPDASLKIADEDSRDRSWAEWYSTAALRRPPIWSERSWRVVSIFASRL